MIRDSSFVTLTLIGKLGPNGTAKGVWVCVCARVYTDVVVMVYVYHSVPGKRSYVPGVTVAASIYSNIWNFDPV